MPNFIYYGIIKRWEKDSFGFIKASKKTQITPEKFERLVWNTISRFLKIIIISSEPCTGICLDLSRGDSSAFYRAFYVCVIFSPQQLTMSFAKRPDYAPRCFFSKVLLVPIADGKLLRSLAHAGLFLIDTYFDKINVNYFLTTFNWPLSSVSL
ncbi:hypothetical protein [Lacihabitans sp. CS3-21]|uniref:hypothetical protein n=1 Tax=Lacihabitans sp. CS3-21 TaxID=2487332 RepID=UPI0020CFE454|nr:hypothetical protein [Lacihabitans sp. CS3-21]MCP9745128.1 hypothetical protein [Lacihabitans sp. CS3-21]